MITTTDPSDMTPAERRAEGGALRSSPFSFDGSQFWWYMVPSV